MKLDGPAALLPCGAADPPPPPPPTPPVDFFSFALAIAIPSSIPVGGLALPLLAPPPPPPLSPSFPDGVFFNACPAFIASKNALR